MRNFVKLFATAAVLTVALVSAQAGLPYFPDKIVGTWCSIHGTDQFVKAQECDSIADTLIIDSDLTWSHDHCILEWDSLGIGDEVHRRDKRSTPYTAHLSCQGRDGPFDHKMNLIFTVRGNILTVKEEKIR